MMDEGLQVIRRVEDPPVNDDGEIVCELTDDEVQQILDGEYRLQITIQSRRPGARSVHFTGSDDWDVR